MTQDEQSLRPLDFRQTELFVKDGLNYVCADTRYFHTDKKPNAYLTDWYVWLVQRGFSTPFFLVIDLGLMFVEDSGFDFTLPQNTQGSTQEFQKKYYEFIYQIYRSGPVRDLIRTTNLEMHLQNVADDSRRHTSNVRDARVKLVPDFLERCLVMPDIHSECVLLDPANVRAVKIDWGAVVSKLKKSENVLTSSENQARKEDYNRRFLESLPTNVSLTLTRADTQLIRAKGLAKDKDIGLDWALLSAYNRNYRGLGNVEHLGIKDLKNLLAISLPTKSSRPEGGYEGIGYDGSLSSIVPSQLAYLKMCKELFFDKYYRNRLLVFERSSRTMRPFAMLMALCFDTSFALRQFDTKLGASTSALLREVAAYLTEDICHHVGMIDGLQLDFWIAPYPQREGWNSLGFRFGEEQRGLIQKQGKDQNNEQNEEGVLAGMRDVLPSFFRLDTLAAGQLDDHVDLPDIAHHFVENAWQDLKKLTVDDGRTDAEQDAEEQGNHYDCVHFCVFTAQTLSDSDLEKVHRDLASFAPHVTFHQFVHHADIDKKKTAGIEWQLSLPNLRQKRTSEYYTYQEIRGKSSELSQHSKSDSPLRRNFVKWVVREALKARRGL